MNAVGRKGLGVATISLKLQTLTPAEPWWPDEERLGQGLVRLVQQNLERGAPTVATVVRPQHVVLVPLAPFADQQVPMPFVLGGLARWNEGAEPPEVIGIIGRVQQGRGQGRPKVPLAIVFLEWPDGRWWHWRQLLDVDGKPIPDAAEVTRAVDGLPRPRGLGGYWTYARRRQPDLKLRRTLPAVRGSAVH